nr:MAG TPA: hypothetical protein [Bacteriophage sp.]
MTFEKYNANPENKNIGDCSIRAICTATREVSDKYNAHLAAQHERAEACRYYKMAAAIVGPEKFLYCPDYAGEMSATFGNDPTEL